MELLINEFLENAADGTQAMDGQPERAWLAIRRLNTSACARFRVAWWLLLIENF